MRQKDIVERHPNHKSFPLSYEWLIVVYIIVGCFFVAIGVPLVWGAVPPNPWYGFRVSQTLNDPAIWYLANAYAGRLLVATGVLLVLAALILPLVKLTRRGYTLAWTAILLASLAVTLTLSWLYMQTLHGTKIGADSAPQSSQPYYLPTDPLLPSLFLYILVGLLLIGLAVPLIQRKVKPNAWYGLRLPQTMGDERIWYQANAYSGRLMLYVGVALIVVASLLALIPGTSFETYGTICLLVLVGGLLFVAWLSWRYACKVSNDLKLSDPNASLGVHRKR